MMEQSNQINKSAGVEMLHRHIERTLKNTIDRSEILSLRSRMTIHHYSRKSLLFQSGQRCDTTHFILKGSCYAYYLDEKGEKIVIQFSLEGYWISDLYSFFSSNPGIYYAEALEDMTVLTLSKQEHESICIEHPIFDRFFRKLIQNAFVAVQYRLTQAFGVSAELRYKALIESHPNFIQRIPQYLIASYLGIQPQSLSRIRRKLLKNDSENKTK